MALRIEDYALVGDLQTAALVGRDGSIDWLCFPRFDSGACFAALLGDAENGRWLLSPREDVVRTKRRYRDGTLVLETDLHTASGAVRLIDFMPPRGRAPDIVRIVEGLSGRVEVRMDLAVRFDYGSVVPWMRRVDGTRLAVAGPDALCLRTPVECRGEDFHTVADFTVAAGERVPFVLTWFPSHEETPRALDAERELAGTESFWRDFGDRCAFTGRYEEPVRSSLRVLKALTYQPTGGLVAAPTTSLPEQPGGVRNWDYRFCWLRDATFALLCMMEAGYESEARSWRDWLLRAVAGDPRDLQAVYGVAGERRLGEDELPWLAGYEGATPVRVGNRACTQLQLDTYGELLDALYEARQTGIPEDPDAWALQRKLLEYLETGWRDPDEGIWEVRGPRRHFTHSKVLSWVAFDRAVRSVERQGLEGPAGRWRALRDELHADICRRAWNAELGAFAQSYDSDRLDAAVLLMPLVGFLPADDGRVVGTVRAIEERLLWDGLVRRYEADDDEVDGLPPGEGVFLPCSFWLADNLALQGRRREAEALYDRLLGLRNDVGLLAEEYEPDAGRQLGNFPQAFSHVAVVNTAFNLDGGDARAHSQARRGGS